MFVILDIFSTCSISDVEYHLVKVHVAVVSNACYEFRISFGFGLVEVRDLIGYLGMILHLIYVDLLYSIFIIIIALFCCLLLRALF